MKIRNHARIPNQSGGSEATAQVGCRIDVESGVMRLDYRATLVVHMYPQDGSEPPYPRIHTKNIALSYYQSCPFLAPDCSVVP
jgi:hypothetical protein